MKKEMYYLIRVTGDKEMSDNDFLIVANEKVKIYTDGVLSVPSYEGKDFKVDSIRLDKKELSELKKLGKSFD